MISDQIYSLDFSHLLSVDLNEMDINLKRTPYSSNLRMLRLLSLKAQNNILFEKTLSEDAILIPDRRLLKRRLNSIEEQKNKFLENQVTAVDKTNTESKVTDDFSKKTENFLAKEELVSKEIVEKQKNIHIDGKTSENAFEIKKIEIKKPYNSFKIKRLHGFWVKT